MKTGDYGGWLECPSGAINGICTSGSDKDCEGMVHMIKCNPNVNVDKT